jgi:hypothetical protein
MVNGTIISFNLSIRRVSEPLTNAVKNVKGKMSIRIKRNLFSVTPESNLNFAIKTRNNRREIEKKNILCTTSI